jgi:hypothetical protein
MFDITNIEGSLGLLSFFGGSFVTFLGKIGMELVTYPLRITISPLDYKGTLDGGMFNTFPGAETFSLAVIVDFITILESTTSSFFGGGEGAIFCVFF